MKDRVRGVSAQLNSSSNSAVTQPVGEARNVRRNQQIKALHEQFEDLKKKIKDVESKNEKIIENIHKQYDFKKKPQTTDYIVDAIVHYQKQQDKGQDSLEKHSDISDKEEREYRIVKPSSKKVSGVKKGSVLHQSVQYRKTENAPEERDPSEISSKTGSGKIGNQYRPPLPGNQFGYSANSQFSIPAIPQEQFQISQFGVNPYQIPMPFPAYTQPNMSLSQAGSYYGNNYQIEENARREKQKILFLQKQLQDREQQINNLRKVQKRFNNISSYYSQTVQLCLEQFYDQVIKKKMGQVEKVIKKLQNRIKKLQLLLKDKVEDQRSRRNIEEHRVRRSHSRSKRESSPKTSSNYNSINTTAPRLPTKRAVSQIVNSAENSSKSKQNQQSKSSTQFQQIAGQYEEMIKVKNKELDSMQQRLKQKEKQLVQMTAKCAKLQIKIVDLAEIPKTSKNRKNSEKQENLLANLDFDNEKDAQIKSLSAKIQELEDNLKQKVNEIIQKELQLDRSNKKTSEAQTKYRKIDTQLISIKNQLKRYENIAKSEPELQGRLKRYDLELQQKEAEYTVLREKCSKFESQKIQKECDIFSLSSKVKKIESLLAVRQEKIQELEKIIQSSSSVEPMDLEKSMYLQKIDQQDLHTIQQQKEKLEDQLARNREEIFLLNKEKLQHFERQKELGQNYEHLKREIETLIIQNESMRINLKVQEFQKYKMEQLQSPLQKLLSQGGDCLSENQDHQLLNEELEDLKAKYEDSQKALKTQSQKAFQENRKAMKLTSELDYFRQQLSDREDKCQKIRKQFEEIRCQYIQLQQQLQEKQSELEVQRRINSEKIKEIENQWLEFEQQVRNNQEESLNTSKDNDLRNSRNFSEESYANYRNTYNNVSAENERLLEKLKQTEQIIEIQKEMEEKIMNQYRANVEKIKGQLREKVKDYERISQQNDHLARKLRILEQSEMRLKQYAKDDDQNLLGNTSTQKVIELEMELGQMREINSKLAAVEQELFKQVAEKEDEFEQLAKLLNAKEKRIEELEDIIQLKQMNFSSHISTSQYKSKIRQSLQSHSSLRYSMLSQNPNKDKTVEIELSQAGESFFDQNQSMISNVSQVFGRDQFPYQKMQLKRVEQRRLFEKTAAYIKSLKHAIDEKNKKIKLLQKKIESLRNSELIRKDIYEIQERLDFEPANDEVFRDYYSVQLESTHSQRYRFKQLQQEAKLTIQENNLLNNQIQNLQEELLKSEQQQGSLMKLKDLYKDEIKSLIKKNQDQARTFEEEIKKEKQKVEQSQSVQKMEALKQLFVKIIVSFIALQTEGTKSKKKEQHKKQLQDYLKVYTNLVSLQASIRDKLLGDIRSLKR